MRITILSALILAASAIACAHPTEDDSAVAAASDLNSARNEDVQVLKVYDSPSFSFSKQSIYGSIDQEQCTPDGGLTWAQIKAHDTATDGWLSITLDCTDAFSKKFGYPSMRAVKVTGSRTKKSEEGYYGYVGFSNSDGQFWAKTVELVVKQSAIDAESLYGAGFYLSSFSYRYYEPAPPPGANNGNAYFVFSEAIRTQANQLPAVTLQGGEKARVIKVLLPSVYASGGTSSVPAFYFRPFVEYCAGGETYQRWDSVASDYFVGTTTSFNRENDILQH